MKIKALVEGILAGVASAIFCYWALISPATIAALAIRSKMPDAWFSGLITWYAMFAVIGVSMAVAGVACRLIYSQEIQTTEYGFGLEGENTLRPQEREIQNSPLPGILRLRSGQALPAVPESVSPSARRTRTTTGPAPGRRRYFPVLNSHSRPN